VFARRAKRWIALPHSPGKQLSLFLGSRTFDQRTHLLLVQHERVEQPTTSIAEHRSAGRARGAQTPPSPVGASHRSKTFIQAGGTAFLRRQCRVGGGSRTVTAAIGMSSIASRGLHTEVALPYGTRSASGTLDPSGSTRKISAASSSPNSPSRNSRVAVICPSVISTAPPSIAAQHPGDL